MKTLNHKFVDKVPETIEEGILYVSIPYETAIHKCCCGCGNEVVTPLSPTDWKLTFNGETITLYPSIGNWSFNCRSHYFIEENLIIWSRMYSSEQIKKVRKVDVTDKLDYYVASNSSIEENDTPQKIKANRKPFWKELFSKWFK